MKVDVNNMQSRHERCKENATLHGVPDLTAANSEILIRHVLDMEAGRHVARMARKGGRSFARLCNIAQRMRQILRFLQDRGVSDIREVTEEQATQLFSDMERGILKTTRGKTYRSSGDYAAVFKAFWHWWMRVNRKEGRVVRDITEDISTHCAQPIFVYLRQEDVERILPYFSEDQQVLLLFLFDSMVRAPTEVLSLRAGDIYQKDDETWVTVRPEISKTIGRSFNLIHAGAAVREYIQRRKLGPEDPLFTFSPPMLNRQLQEAAYELWGDERSHPQGDLYRKLTLYDFRHSGAIHFRLLAKDNPSLVSLDAVCHRAGWTNLQMLNYYTRFIGLDGHIKGQEVILRRERPAFQAEIGQLRDEITRIKDEIHSIAALATSGSLELQAPTHVPGEELKPADASESDALPVQASETPEPFRGHLSTLPRP